MLKALLTGSLPLLALLSAACSSDVRRFPLRDPVWRDADLNPVSLPCRPDPEAPKDDPQHRLCTPEEYESSFAWDAADNLVFRPVSRFFAVEPGGEAVNVNSLDEVPDSSWFTNRIGKKPISAEELVRGPCGDKTLDPEAPDGAWVIDMGKPNGANPGFRVKVEGVGKFMLKADPQDQPERATGATAIAARLYHAAGFWAPCDSVVYLKPSVLKLSPGLIVTDNSGVSRPFDQAALDGVLAKAAKRGDRVRMVASRWLPGRALGPFKYEGTRDDDPNDVLPHEDRRDLRGGRLLAAWLNHFDSREQNSMDVWLAEDEKDKDASPGHVRHYYIDLGDCFGSEWEWEEISKRLGHAYYFDTEYVLLDFITLGIPERPWDRARRDAQGDIFGFFSDRDFRPEGWRGGYPNPAFARMTELDGAWAARTLARFTPELIEAAVRTGDFTAPRHTTFLVDKLIQRKRAIMARYLTRLSPIADVALAAPAELCGVDLARRAGVARPQDLRHEAAMYAGEALALRARPAVRPSPDGRVCLSLPHIAPDGGAPDDAPSRYAIVDVVNGHASGPLRAHLYDLGPRRGYKLVGIERPEDADPPD
ncbi:hypothetical protein WME94_41065 [Sorangium sp. So ce429]